MSGQFRLPIHPIPHCAGEPDGRFADDSTSCAAIPDAGFADRSMIPVLLRRIRLRTAVADARASIEALANLLDQYREALTSDGAALREEGVGLTGGDQQGRIGGGAVNLGEGHAMREDELLQGVKLITQLLDRIEIGIRHGLFSSAGETEGKRACDAAHRLSGGAK